MHSVSLGESQISTQFAKTIKDRSPNTIIVASSCTETGQAVLENSEYIDFNFYYPADLFFLIKPLFEKIKPKAILVMETDLWPNMLHIAKEKSVPIYVLNAKISENSFNTYKKFPFLKKRLLDPLGKLYTQCKSYQQRFIQLGVEESKLDLQGNIKLDRYYAPKAKEESETFLSGNGLSAERKTIVFASTHPREEQGFIDVYKMLLESFPDLQMILVPRHPERFGDVAALLKQNQLAFYRYSEQDKYHTHEDKISVLLIDAMGVLMDAYAACDISIVAGSFTTKVGGHNIFEPAHFAKPIVYGPWMFKQPGFHELIQEHEAAIQIKEENWQEPLMSTLVRLLKNEEEREKLGQRAKDIIRDSQGTGVYIFKSLQKMHPELLASESSPEETNN
jgi:3-deoxy-D-manno-octulosonic-acid transferase